MKDATGELSMTAIAVVAIAAIGIVFTTLIWPGIKANITRSTNCAQSYACEPGAGNNNMDRCWYLDKNEKPQQIDCPNQGGHNKN